MSLENAKKLIKKLSGNEELKSKFKAAGEKGFDKLVKDLNLPCTIAEFQEAVKSAAQDFDANDPGDPGVQAVVVVSIAVV